MLKTTLKIETKMHLEKLNNNKKYNFETLGQKSDYMLDYMPDFRPNTFGHLVDQSYHCAHTLALHSVW